MTLPTAMMMMLAPAIVPVPPVDLLSATALHPPRGYHLVWADEFNRPGLPDPAKWVYDTALNKTGWANHEKQYYSGPRARNARVENGHLIIEAHVEALDRQPDWGRQRYTSARLKTRGKASWTYGFVEARAKIPCGVGTWPAIWMLADVPRLKWPDDGEIDIMEHVGYIPGIIHQTVHTKAYNHVIATQRGSQTGVADACQAFHIYQLHWTPQRIVMGVDGRTAFAFDRTPGDRGKWPFDGPQYLILNLAIGGDWGGAEGIDDKALPARMEVDYVRVYQARAKARPG